MNLKDLLALPRRVVITGHTSGIGRAFADWFNQRGHDVTGLSRSTGHDISDTDKITQIVQQSEIFVNNAWQGFDQSRIMYHIHHAWRGQRDRAIIAVSSARSIKITEYHEDPEMNQYKAAKLGLDWTCQHLWNHDPWPRIYLLRPGHTDTKFTASSTRPKMQPQALVDYYMSCLLSAPSDIFLQDLTIRESHELQHIRKTQ